MHCIIFVGFEWSSSSAIEKWFWISCLSPLVLLLPKL